MPSGLWLFSLSNRSGQVLKHFDHTPIKKGLYFHLKNCDCLSVCCGSLTSGQLLGVLSRLLQGKAFHFFAPSCCLLSLTGDTRGLFILKARAHTTIFTGSASESVLESVIITSSRPTLAPIMLQSTDYPHMFNIYMPIQSAKGSRPTTVYVDIFACINFRAFPKIGNFARIYFRVFDIIASM